MKCIKMSCLMVTGLCLSHLIHAQSVSDSVKSDAIYQSSRFLQRTQDRVTVLTSKLVRQTETNLLKMQRQEQQLRKKLAVAGPNKTGDTLASSDRQYEALLNRMRSDSGGRTVVFSGPYLANADSLQGVLKFLASKGNSMGSNAAEAQKAVGQLQVLEAKMQDAELAKQFLQQRKGQIDNYLQHYTNLPGGVTGAFASYKKQAYYYSQRVQAYKEELNNPDRLLTHSLQQLNRLSAFTGFMKRHSVLASLLNIPTDAPTGEKSVGLLSRDKLMASLGGGNPAAAQPQGSGPAMGVPEDGVAGSAAGPTGASGGQSLMQNIGTAQGQVDGMRDKLTSMGEGSGGDLNAPDFNPNPQHIKSFLHRLELGTNLQSTSSSLYFPTTTDIGLSLGYRLNSKNVIGVGISYKIGWGQDIHHIHLSGEGIGLRSFADIHIDKSFFVSGGFEYNYQQPFSIQGIPSHLDDWQKSGLIGISKIISMKSRPFKNTKLQLLWDFLSYNNRPPTQPLKFRVGYSF